MTELAMKPSARLVLDRLRQGPATTHDLLNAGCGSRFGARIAELRALGFQIAEERLPLPTRGSQYTLTFDAEDATERAGRDDTQRESSVTERAAGAQTDGAALFDAAAYAGGDYRDAA